MKASRRLPLVPFLVAAIAGGTTLHGTPARGATFVVDTTNDDDDDNPGDGVCFSTLAGGCSLSAAIQEANQHAGPDRIHFAIGGGPGVKSIPQLTLRNISTSEGVIAVALPPVREELVIDGWTQGGAGYRGPPLIEVRGTLGTAAGDCLFISSGSVTVRGLIIGGYARGILLHNGGGNAVQGCYIGTDPTGTLAHRNDDAGIVVSSSDNTIGGSTARERNLISGNGTGISLYGPGATRNAILGSFIGTDAVGTSALGNGIGIILAAGASQNRIGSAAPGDRNVISGNDGNAIVLLHGCSDNRILGNFLGPDSSGGGPLGNHSIDVAILDSSNNQVGTVRPGEGNTIAGSTSGVYVFDLGLMGTSGNSVRGNSIYECSFLGTNLTNDAVTPNDQLDADVGPNGLQNYPELVGAVSTADATVVQGSLESLPDTRFSIDLYASPECSPSGHGDGKTYLQTIAVLTGADGRVSFELELDARVEPGQLITAVTVNPDTQDTSEHSRCVQITEPFVVTTTGDDGRGSLRAAIHLANATPGTSEIEFRIPDRAAFHTIVLESPLPEIEEPVRILGSSQPAFSGQPLIVLDGSQAGTDASGLHLGAGNSLVEGLVVQRFSGNGIVITGPGGDAVRGCLIGTGAQGLADAGNAGSGIAILMSPDNAIGGADAGARNVIAGNDEHGIFILGEGATRNRLQGNFIGTDAGGEQPLGNAGDGIRIGTGADDNVIGGVDPGEGNRIAFNATGVRIAPDTCTGNRIRGNAMFLNLGPGIDLGQPGRDANDRDDLDAGANDLQNYPVLTAATLAGEELTVSGFLVSDAGSDFALDFYASLPGDGDGAGRIYLGSAPVTTTGNRADFDVTLAHTTPEATRITATATRVAAPASSSELSAARALTELGGRQVPGDCNQDGVLDISDASCLVGFLFLGRPNRLPCGDGSLADPGNVALIDWQPDGGIDISDSVAMLTFLFSGGAPHPAAVIGDETHGCVEIPGCEDAGTCP